MQIKGIDGPLGNQCPAEEQPVAKPELKSEMGAVSHCDLRRRKISPPNEMCMTHCR